LGPGVITARRAAIAVLMFAAISVGLSTAAPNDLPAAKHFSHADHASKGVVVDKCDACHAIDSKGQVLIPAAQGHSPCLEAKCHASSFLAVGAKQKAADPVAFNKAAAFCLGCHDSVPWPWKKQEMRVLHSFQNELEYHVEMNHYEHTQKKVPSRGSVVDCRSCHAVDVKSFALVTGAPGHAQCALCHNAKDYPEFTMALCGNCHSRPARADYFLGSRPKNDVRACDSEGVQLLKDKFAKEGRTKAKGEVPCFRHERVEHRFLDKTAATQPLECNSCHTMVDDKKKWHPGQRYQSLKDLHVAVIINNNGSEDQHKACGKTAACHRADVDTVNGGHCSLCHAEKWAF